MDREGASVALPPGHSSWGTEAQGRAEGRGWCPDQRFEAKGSRGENRGAGMGGRGLQGGVAWMRGR